MNRDAIALEVLKAMIQNKELVHELKNRALDKDAPTGQVLAEEAYSMADWMVHVSKVKATEKNQIDIQKPVRVVTGLN